MISSSISYSMVIFTQKFIIYSVFLVLVVASTSEINDNNSLCLIEYNICFTNTIDLKMSTKSVNVCVNFGANFKRLVQST